MKICIVCELSKPATDFYAKWNRCKECISAINKIRGPSQKTTSAPVTAEYVRSVLDYDQDSGLIFWKVHGTAGIKPGHPAGSLQDNGYIKLKIRGTRHQAHRVIWLWMTGEWPSMSIDHINGMPNDNRWSNLRLATQSEQVQNQRTRRDSTTGLKGVTFMKKSGLYLAQVGASNARLKLGPFKTAHEAHQAYCEAADRMYGEFARHA